MKSRKQDVLKAFEEYLIIDKNKLDQEVMQQSSLLHKVGKEFAKATGVAVTRKDQLKRIDAKLAVRHRKKLEKLGRATDSMITTAVLLDIKHEEAFDIWNKAVVHADKLESLKESFKQRGFMLRDLIGMYLSDYFSKDSFDNSEQIKSYKQTRVHDKRKK